MSNKPITKLETSTANWVGNRLYELSEIPEPGQEWTSSEADLDDRILTSLMRRGLVTRVRGKRDKGDRRYYKTKPKLYDAIQTYKEQHNETDRLLPCDDPACPGSGFRNIGDGQLECRHCGQVHDRDDVRS